MTRSADGYVLRTVGIVTIRTIASGSAVRSNHVPGIRIPVPRWWGTPIDPAGRSRGLRCARPGDMVTMRASRLTPATSTDSALVGNVLRCGGSAAEIITDAEAVYGVTDPHPRAIGTMLDLAGGSGRQHVAVGPNRAFQVVIDCSAAEETLLRISPGRQRGLPIALLRDARAPGMSPVHERRLVADAAAGDPEARRELVEAYLPAIGSIARLYRSTPGVGREELLQEGVVGLLRALGRFDPEFGAPFWAYACWWVRQAMQQIVSDLTHAARSEERRVGK